MKRIVAFLVIFILSFQSTLGLTVSEKPDPFSYRDFLSLQGLQFGDDAQIETSSFTTSSGLSVNILKIEEQQDENVTCSFYLPLSYDENGDVEIIDIETAILTQSSVINQNSTNMSGSGGPIDGVTAVGYYNRKTKPNNYTTLYYYQPYRITAMASASKSFEIDYQIAGAPYNNSLVYQSTAPEWHNINLKVNNCVANQVYGKTSSSSYYYSILSGAYNLYHRIYFTIGGVYQGYVTVTSI